MRTLAKLLLMLLLRRVTPLSMAEADILSDVGLAIAALFAGPGVRCDFANNGVCLPHKEGTHAGCERCPVYLKADTQ